MKEEELKSYFLTLFLKTSKTYVKRREEEARKPLCLTLEEEELSLEWETLEYESVCF
jgi:hypothetical protein